MWEDTLKRYAEKMGQSGLLKHLKSWALTLHTKPQQIFSRGMQRDTLHEQADLMESLIHEGTHADDWVNQIKGAMSEGRAYPKGWEAKRRLLEHYKLDPNSVIPDIPIEYIKNLDDKALQYLQQRNRSQFVQDEIIRVMKMRNPSSPKITVGYDSLGRKIEQLNPEWVKANSASPMSTRARILTDRIKEAEGVKSIEDFKRTFADFNPQDIQELLANSAPEEVELIKKLSNIRSSLEGRWK
jgi:hypothetical protein